LSEIPDAWPADDLPPLEGKVVPIFPLKDVWLVPNALMPLYIFEPRYRALVDDVLDKAGEYVLGTVVQGYEGQMAAAPPIYPVAGLGVIQNYKRLDDGCYEIWLAGRERVFVEEIDSDRLYRQVRITRADEQPAPDHLEGRLREDLTSAILERSEDLDKLPADLPLGCLADLLTLRINPPHERWHAIYSELDVQRRAELALAEHAEE
jgi:Lon protease-like protein